MKRDEIIQQIIGLSHSQGMYGRLYEDLCSLKEDDEDYYNLLMATWEDCGFDAVGFIEFVESEPVNIFSVEEIQKWRENVQPRS